MTRINLLPWRETLREERKKQFYQVLAAASALALMIVMLFHLIINNQFKLQQRKAAYLQKEIEILDKRIVEIQNLKQQKEALIARMQIVEELQANRPLTVHIFDELVKILPDGAFFDAISREESNLILHGRVDSNTNVSELMRHIADSRWLTNPLLTEIKTQKDDQKSTFKLQLLQKNAIRDEGKADLSQGSGL
ncbi:MAG: PilN domain-containing protein [Gammaproteobacteria bacterium]